MLRNKTIPTFVRQLEERRISLYHACQLRDFESYLKVGGIPSRHLLERRGLWFTTFDTDQQDQKNDVWSKVFLNLEDFGRMFSRGKNAVPNPYGPILIAVQPCVLLRARDVAVCLKSAGARRFDRKGEALALGDTQRIFKSPRTAKIKSRWDLKKEFSDHVEAPELSCTYTNQCLPFVQSGQCLVKEVIVDPCDTGCGLLKDAVGTLRDRYCIDSPVKQRSGSNGNRGYRDHYRKIIEALHNLPRKPGRRDLEAALDRLAQSQHQKTRNWARSIQKKPGLTKQFVRFGSYLVKGTLA